MIAACAFLQRLLDEEEQEEGRESAHFQQCLMARAAEICKAIKSECPPKLRGITPIGLVGKLSCGINLNAPYMLKYAGLREAPALAEKNKCHNAT